MILKLTSFADLNMEQLMQIYIEGNTENAAYFYPDEHDLQKAVKLCEERFSKYLKNEFYSQPGRTYWILEENGQWVSALRTSVIKENLYYIEALETRPEFRKHGYAAKLLLSVTEDLKTEGTFSLCSCVNKQNIPSLKTHIKSGFRIVADSGFNYLQNTDNPDCYGMRYDYNLCSSFLMDAKE